jgi:hypothetical protein
MAAIIESYNASGVPPKFEIIQFDESISGFAEELIENFHEYRKKGDLAHLLPEELDLQLKKMVPLNQTHYLMERHKQINTILSDPKKAHKFNSPISGEEEPYQGIEGAHRLLKEHLASPEAKDPFDTTNPRLHAPADFRDDPNEAVQELFEPQGVRLKTGILKVDTTVRMSNGNLVGVLGYTGSGKSRWGRTICYNAAMDGRSMLHITTEQQRKSTRAHYLIAHAWKVDPEKSQRFGISCLGWEKDLWTPEAREFMRDVTHDLSKQEGGVTVVFPRNRSWTGIEEIIKDLSSKRLYDAVFLDYLTHLLPVNSRNLREDMSRMIHSAQNLAATYDGGRGLVFISPVQGNKKGYDDAQKNGGIWESTGLSDWSAFTQDCDVLFYIYQDEDLKACDEIKIGTCKVRTGCDLPITTLSVHPATQMFRSQVATPFQFENLVDDL